MILDKLIVQPEDSVPIYQQLEHQILRFIRNGHLRPGEALPSVRAIASQIAVNPMTVSKTINRLVEQGWLTHRRGKPTCVANPLPAIHSGIDPQLKQALERVIEDCRQLDISEIELNKLLHTLWQEHDS